MSEFKGIIRQVDSLGRIVIPKEIRKQLEINDGEDCLQMTLTDTGELILRKYRPYCLFCGQEGNLSSLNEKSICKECINKLKSQEDI